MKRDSLQNADEVMPGWKTSLTKGRENRIIYSFRLKNPEGMTLL